MFSVFYFMTDEEVLRMQLANRRCYKSIVPRYRPCWKMHKVIRRRVTTLLLQNWEQAFRAVACEEAMAFLDTARLQLLHICLPVVPVVEGFRWCARSFRPWHPDDKKNISWQGVYIHAQRKCTFSLY